MLRKLIRPLALIGVAACLVVLALPARSDNAADSGDKFAKAIAGKERVEGFFTLYRGDGKVLMELSATKLSKPFLMMSSIARGVAAGGFVNGTTLDTYVLCFDQTENDKLRLIHKNVRYQKPDGPLGKAFEIGFSDSPIMTIDPVATSGSRILIDLDQIFMRDIEGIAGAFRGLYFDRDGSSWGDVKSFPENTELRVNLLFNSAGRPVGGGSVGLADPRGVEIVMHYSLHQMPDNGYKPRVADDRVGYFTTVLYDFAEPKNTGFDRFINRWRIEKADPRAEKSPAKKSVVFWIENTVPYEYRPYIRQAIEAWNRAFEAAGILNAIEVRQMPENADWDPEDARYNTIRWTAAFNMGFAIGPSRVNPLTGEIIDADILVDANFPRYFERSFRLMNETGEDSKRPMAERREKMRDMVFGGDRLDPEKITYAPEETLLRLPAISEAQSKFKRERQRRMLQAASIAGLATALSGTEMPGINTDGLPPTLIGDALRELVMHEVGHTLGLRHNFKGSTLLSVDQLKDRGTVDQRGFTASVMDYMPMFVTADPAQQGYFYASDIGPYDVFAIRYGYTQFGGDESAGLATIASESAKPEHIYGTDEDAYGAFGIDPYCRTWDIGSEPLKYAQESYDLVRRLWKRDWQKLVADAEGDRFVIRQGVNTLINTHFSATYNAVDFIGGIRHYRHRASDPGAKHPVEPVSSAVMREALQLVAKETLGPNSFEIPGELLQDAAPTRWGHWGYNSSPTINLHIADEIQYEREMAIYYLHSAWLINSLREIALIQPDALTPAECFDTAMTAVWDGIDAADGIPADRRTMQAEYLTLIAEFATTPPATYPREGRVLAGVMLKRSQEKIQAALANQNHAASRIHLEAMNDLATRALSAQPIGRVR